MSARVQQAYFTLLGRPADPAGLKYWDEVSASLTDAQLYEALAASPEYQAISAQGDTSARLTEIYQNAFGRLPDADGLAYWLEVVAADGGDIAAIARAAASIVATPAADSADAIAVGNKTQVAIALTDALSVTNHADSIDVTTLAAAKALLAGTGSTPLPNAATLEATITAAVQTVSTDTLAKVNATVQTLYVAVFGRPADPDGLTFWGSALDALGGDAAALATRFISADNAEFAATYGTLNSQQFLATIYQNLTGRTPDAEGANFWNAGIANLSDGGASTLSSYAAVAAQIVQAIAANPTSTDASVAKNTAAVAQSFTQQLIQQAGPDADFSQISASDLASARDLLNSVTADPASVTQAQAQVAALANDVLEQVGVPVVNPPVVVPPVVTPPVVVPPVVTPPVVTPPIVTPPTKLALTVDAELANDNPATGAFKTIQAAIDAVGATQTAVIKVAAGTYEENLVLKSGLTIEGQGAVRVLSVAGDNAVLAQHAKNITIKNIAFEQTGDLVSQLKFNDTSGVTLDQVSLVGNGSESTTGLYLNGVVGATLSQVNVQSYGQNGIAVVAKDAAPNWQVSKDLTFSNITLTDNGTGIAFDTRGTGVYADPVDADAEINGVIFGGTNLISENGTGIRFGEADGQGRVQGALVTTGFGDPRWELIKVLGAAVKGNALNVASNDRSYGAYVIAADTNDVTVDFAARLELIGDVPQLVTITEAVRYLVNLGGSANLDLQRDSTDVWLSGVERDTPYAINIKSSGSDLNFSVLYVTDDVRLKLDANALQTLEFSGINTTSKIILDETSQLNQLSNIKLSFLVDADFVLNLENAGHAIVLDSAYYLGSTSFSTSRVNYTASEHGDTINIGGRYGSTYVLGAGNDVVSYVGSTPRNTDPSQPSNPDLLSTAGVSQIGTRDFGQKGVVDAFDTIKNFGQSDLLRINTNAELNTFGDLYLVTENMSKELAQAVVTPMFRDGIHIVFADVLTPAEYELENASEGSLTHPTKGYLFVDLDKSGAYEADRDFAIKIELIGDATFSLDNIEFFAPQPATP